MRLTLLLLGALMAPLLTSWTPLAAQDSGEIPEATIRSYCEPASVRIGEPFTLKVDIVHSRRQRVLLDVSQNEVDLELGDRWVLADERRTVSLPLDDQPGMQLTQARWRLFGLEPGDYELLALGADCVASGAVQRLDAVPATIAVLPELVEGEDEARTARGFRDEVPQIAEPLRTLILGLLGVIVAGVLIGVLLLLRGRRGRAPVDRGPTPLDKLGAIDPGDPEGARDAFYLLSRAVREAIDQQAGAGLEGLTDEEWIERRLSRNGVPRERLERAATLLRSCESVKYGAESPTRWAVEEALGEARELCSAPANDGASKGRPPEDPSS